MRNHFRLPGMHGHGAHLYGQGEQTLDSQSRRIRADVQRGIQRKEAGRWSPFNNSDPAKLAEAFETRDTTVPVEKPGDTRKGKQARKPGAAPRDHKAERAERKRRWKELAHGEG